MKKETLQRHKEKLKSLQDEQEEIILKIENLRKEHVQKNVVDYQTKLNSLLDSLVIKRDEIRSQSSFIDKFIEEERKQDKAISQIEKLLGVHISPIIIRYNHSQSKTGRVFLKDTAYLRKEQGKINKRLEELLDEGGLDSKTYRFLKVELIKKFDSMVAEAPKPSINVENQTPNPEEYSRIEPMDLDLELAAESVELHEWWSRHVEKIEELDEEDQIEGSHRGFML